MAVLSYSDVIIEASADRNCLQLANLGLLLLDCLFIGIHNSRRALHKAGLMQSGGCSKWLAASILRFLCTLSNRVASKSTQTATLNKSETISDSAVPVLQFYCTTALLGSFHFCPLQHQYRTAPVLRWNPSMQVNHRTYKCHARLQSRTACNKLRNLKLCVCTVFQPGIEKHL